MLIATLLRNNCCIFTLPKAKMKISYATMKADKRLLIFAAMQLKILSCIYSLNGMCLASFCRCVQTDLCLTWSEIPKTNFLVMWLVLPVLPSYFSANEKLQDIKSKPKNSAQMVSFRTS